VTAVLEYLDILFTGSGREFYYLLLPKITLELFLILLTTKIIPAYSACANGITMTSL